MGLSRWEYRALDEKLDPDLGPAPRMSSLGDAFSLAPVNQPTEQSYGNEQVSNCFQSGLAATCYPCGMGEKQELIVAM